MAGLVAVALLVMIAPARAGASGAGPAGPRPNIVLLILDDQDAFTPFWEAMPTTAAMVRDRGVNFRTAIAPTPICTPSRATMLSGRLAHNTGVYTLSGPTGARAFLNQVDRTFPVELMKRGYVTAMFGKCWGPRRANPGWSEWCALTGDRLYEGYGYEATEDRSGGRPETTHPEAYSTDFLSDRMARFLDDHKARTDPFFVWLAPTAPHLPLPPAPRHAKPGERWTRALPLRPNFDEPDVGDKSAWLRDSASNRSLAVPFARQEYPKRMGSLMAVDEMMAKIRDRLIAQGKWENTVVVLTSDNGYNLGSHRLIHKQAPYEESLRVPLFVAGPGIAHAEIRKIVGLHDLAPTFIELAGGEPPADYDGKSLVPFLRKGSDDVAGWRTSLLAEYNDGGVHSGYNPGGPMREGYAMDVPTFRAIRSETHKYIRFTSSGDEELYDLRSDPFELKNSLRSNPEPSVKALRDEYRRLLEAQQGLSGRDVP